MSRWTMVGGMGAAALAVIVAGARLASPTPARPHVLIVTLDTTRADRLSVYGSSSIATPSLERLARDGVVFENASSVAPLTLTSHVSLFTGLYPPHHGVRDNADPPLAASHPTLAEIVHARGWRTAAFVSSVVLGRDRGLARGFDVYDDGGASQQRRAGNDVVDRALAWLDSSAAAPDTPFLLWVHLYDAHAPQSPPAAFGRRYGGDPYAGGVAFADMQVGRLVDALERRHLLDATTIVVAGDHGESLGDHGEAEHGIFLYDSVLHVPLIVRVPAVAPGRITIPVSLVDVMPTLMDVLHVPAGRGDGISLLAALRGDASPSDRLVYAESMYPRHFGWSPLRSVRDARFKYIDAPRPELYDLVTDPFEQHDLAASHPGQAAAMRNGLMAAGDGVDGPAASPELRERIAALGYASGAARGVFAQGIDPKDTIDRYNAVMAQRRLPSR
jgi:choline-sulfatase